MWWMTVLQFDPGMLRFDLAPAFHNAGAGQNKSGEYENDPDSQFENHYDENEN